VPNELWELKENPSTYDDYNWFSKGLPARQFYMFIAEVGNRLRHIMTNPGSIQMIEHCEQCAEGRISEEELDVIAHGHRAEAAENIVNQYANNLYWWVANRHNVSQDGVFHASEVFAFLAATNMGLLLSGAIYDEIEAVRESPIFVSVHESTRLEWGLLIRDIYGPNPFRPVTFSPDWRTSTVVSLAKSMYDSRDFSPMPILSDALQDAGCEHEDILNHCRGASGIHVRGCWVVDLVLGKS
jgi:hypothetical protein